MVLQHAKKALQYYEKITENEKEMVLYASLLHDADDGKFFKNNKNYENLRFILSSIDKDDKFIETVVYMVSLVSSSKNGDYIPDDIKDREWFLIPRYSDRLEAIGIDGLERCNTYRKNVSHTPLYTQNSPKPTNIDDIWKCATIERYKAYTGNGKSESLIDHFYDKLLRVSFFPIHNEYFDNVCEYRRKEMTDFLLYFGKSEKLTNEDIENYVLEYCICQYTI
jgi:uncharacterized protein